MEDQKSRSHHGSDHVWRKCKSDAMEAIAAAKKVISL